MPATKEGQESIKCMTVDTLLSDPFTTVAKELRYASGRDDRLPNNILLANAEVQSMIQKSTDGRSVGWMDMINAESSSNPIIATLPEESRIRLSRVSRGLTMEEVAKESGDAVAGFKTIKVAVARQHGAANSIITLALARVLGGNYDRSRSINSGDIIRGDGTIQYSEIRDRVRSRREDREDDQSDNPGCDEITQGRGVSTLQQILLDLAAAKRILTEEGLSAKHGTIWQDIDQRATQIQEILYYPERAGWVDRNQVYEFLTTQCRLPHQSANTILDTIWSDPPVNVNQVLREVAPTYMMTRRGAKLTLLDNWADRGIDNTITQLFLGR